MFYGNENHEPAGLTREGNDSVEALSEGAPVELSKYLEPGCFEFND